MERMIKRWMGVMLMVSLLVMGGCQTVHVRDHSGEPVNMAKVVVIDDGGGIASLPVYTNFLGDAILGANWSGEGMEKLVITADDFRSRKIVRSNESHIEVTLIKAIGARPAMRARKSSIGALKRNAFTTRRDD
jgi:hypothetical protein